MTMPYAQTFTIEQAALLFHISIPFTKQQLSKTYRHLLKQHHPDLFMHADKETQQKEQIYTQDLNNAYQVFLDALKNNFAFSSSGEFGSPYTPYTYASHSYAPRSSATTTPHKNTYRTPPWKTYQRETPFSSKSSTEEPEKIAWRKKKEAWERDFDWRWYRDRVPQIMWDFALEAAETAKPLVADSWSDGYRYHEHTIYFFDEDYIPSQPEIRAAGWAAALLTYWRYFLADLSNEGYDVEDYIMDSDYDPEMNLVSSSYVSSATGTIGEPYQRAMDVYASIISFDACGKKQVVQLCNDFRSYFYNRFYNK